MSCRRLHIAVVFIGMGLPAVNGSTRCTRIVVLETNYYEEQIISSRNRVVLLKIRVLLGGIVKNTGKSLQKRSPLLFSKSFPQCFPFPPASYIVRLLYKTNTI